MQVSIPQTYEKIADEDLNPTSAWFTFFQDVWRAVRGGLRLRLGGVFSIDTTSVANSGTSETDLISYTLSKNTLKTNGDLIEIEAWGTYAANGNSKTVKLVFGSQTILTTGAIAANDGSWKINTQIIRTAAATQEICASIISSNSSVADSSTRTAGTQNLATDLTIKCTGTSGTASSDITQYALIVKLTPYD